MKNLATSMPTKSHKIGSKIETKSNTKGATSPLRLRASAERGASNICAPYWVTIFNSFGRETYDVPTTFECGLTPLLETQSLKTWTLDRRSDLYKHQPLFLISNNDFQNSQYSNTHTYTYSLETQSSILARIFWLQFVFKAKQSAQIITFQIKVDDRILFLKHL